MERERFVDKIALVTGGANGLGRGMVEQLVKEGAQVAIFDIEDDTMEEVFGGNDHVFCVHCDVRDYDQVQESVQKVIDRYGRIDVFDEQCRHLPSGAVSGVQQGGMARCDGHESERRILRRPGCCAHDGRAWREGLHREHELEQLPPRPSAASPPIAPRKPPSKCLRR